MIPYVVRAKRKPGDQSPKFYAQMAPVTPLNFAEVATEIEKMSTVTDADVKAVLMCLETVVINSVRRGASVRLGTLGSFRPTLSSAPSLTAEGVSAKSVKAVRCRFTQGSGLRRALRLQSVEIKAYKMPTEGAGEGGDEPEA